MMFQHCVTGWSCLNDIFKVFLFIKQMYPNQLKVSGWWEIHTHLLSTLENMELASCRKQNQIVARGLMAT